MKLASRPARVPVPFADQGTKNAIPVNSQIGVKDGAASYTDGFPPLTMTPIAAGGIPPAGGDFNGILNAITQSVRWACAGGQYAYDDAFSTAIGGYPKGALIQNAAGDVIWLNTADDNKTNPDTGTGWSPAIRYGLTTVALAGSNVTLTPAQAAKETIVLTGALTANVQLIMPAWVETWLIVNNTTGNFTVAVKPAAGSGVNLAASTSSQIYGDGTNIYYGALMVRNNLAEIKAAGTNSQLAACNNIAAVPTSRKVNGHALSTDVNVTAQDIFNGQAIGIGDADLNSYTTPGLYYQPANAQATTGKNYPETVAGSLEIYKHAGITQIYRVYNSSRSYIRTLYGSAWSAWTKQYDAANKPTAGDVGALPLTGGTLNGNLTVKNTIQIGVVGSAVLNIGDNDSGLRNSKDGQVDLWANSKVVGYWNGTTLSFTGQIIPTNYANFDARYQAKGSYTPTGTAYTKAESDARYNLKNTATKATNAMTSKDASTGVMEVVMSNITVAANTNVSVTFSTAFPSACVGVVIAYDGAGHGDDQASAIAVTSYSRTGCVLHAYNANGKFMLIAKGY
ncbi:pyocin knob domain-containing protein [Enterobacter hormaechei]|uniref:pyocin knob domain-containing protein n=1 Tax=Enterobacter hormaechei TaxID=158836 RepID=UPI00335C5B89